MTPKPQGPPNVLIGVPRRPWWLDLLMLLGAALAVTGPPLVLLAWTASETSRARAECQARGGVLVEARQPLYTCVQPPPTPRSNP